MVVPPPLSDAQLAEFVLQGFLVLPLQLPEGWTSAFYSKALQLKDSGLERSEIWAQISADTNVIAAAPALRGALTSILGPDYLMPPNGTLHYGLSEDQGFHKDGTDHGAVQNTVRDHRLRHVLIFAYMADITANMGPTAVLPRSHFLGINKDGFSASEQRLMPDLVPPVPARGRASVQAWAQKQAAAAALNSHADLAVRDAERMHGARELLGDHDLAEVFATVPEGSCLLCHHDLFHRASRVSPGANWRPMIKIAAARMSDPPPSHPTTTAVSQLLLRKRSVDSPGNAVHMHAVHAAVVDFLAGARSCDTAAAHLAELRVPQQQHKPTTASLSVEEAMAHVMRTDPSEGRRLNAGYSLGYLSAAGSEPALAQLLSSAKASEERMQRAAFYGLTVAGPAAVGAMTGWVASVPAHLGMTLAHSLGQAAVPLVTSVDAEAATRACEALMELVQRTSKDLVSYSGDDEENASDEVDFFATDRRRVLSECCCSLGLMMQHLLRLEAAATVLSSSSPSSSAVATLACQVLEVALLPLMLHGEIGVAFPSFLMESSVSWNAANALLHMCSAASYPGGCGVAAVPTKRNPFAGTSGSWDITTIAGMVAEARYRVSLPPRTQGRKALDAALGQVAWTYETGCTPYVDPVVHMPAEVVPSSTPKL